MISNSNSNSKTSFFKHPILGAFLSFVGIVLIASNLRSPLASVGPVLNEISRDLGLSNTSAGILTAIPLIIFAGFSGLVGRLSVKHKIEKLLGIALIVLAIGLVLRVNDGVYSLFAGSALVGVGICIGNVLMPGFIKQEFPNKVGLMTGVYSVSMNLTAALAAGLSIVVGEWTQMGWKASIGIWALLAIFSLLVWIPKWIQATNKTLKVGAVSSKRINIFRSKQAWNISAFMGLQSLLYYCFAAWLPAVLVDYGMSREDAGWVLSFLQLAMLPVTFIGPIVAARMKNQVGLVIFLGGCMMSGLVLLSVFKLDYVYVAAILLGMSNGLAFGLAMLFFSLRTETPSLAIVLSGMAQSIGYLLAAFGPPLFGKLFDVTADWSMSFYFLMFITVLMLLFGGLSARNKTIEKGLKV